MDHLMKALFHHGVKVQSSDKLSLPTEEREEDMDSDRNDNLSSSSLTSSSNSNSNSSALEEDSTLPSDQIGSSLTEDSEQDLHDQHHLNHHHHRRRRHHHTCHQSQQIQGDASLSRAFFRNQFSRSNIRFFQSNFPEHDNNEIMLLVPCVFNLEESVPGRLFLSSSFVDFASNEKTCVHKLSEKEKKVPVIQGYMYQKETLMWNKYFFVAKDSQLYRLNSPQDGLKYVAPLVNLEQSQVKKVKSLTGKDCLLLETKDHTFKLRAVDPSLNDQWLSALSLASVSGPCTSVKLSFPLEKVSFTSLETSGSESCRIELRLEFEGQKYSFGLIPDVYEAPLSEFILLQRETMDASAHSYDLSGLELPHLAFLHSGLLPNLWYSQLSSSGPSITRPAKEEEEDSGFSSSHSFSSLTPSFFSPLSVPSPAVKSESAGVEREMPEMYETPAVAESENTSPESGHYMSADLKSTEHDQTTFESRFQLKDRVQASFVCKRTTIGRLYITENGFYYYSSTGISRNRISLPFKNIKKIQLESNLWSATLHVKTNRKQELEFHNYTNKHQFLAAIQEFFKPNTVELSTISMDALSSSSDLEEFDFENEQNVINQLSELHNRGTTSLERKRNILILTIGSHGDVQPYVALALQLMQKGDDVTIATHSEFRTFVESHGILFEPLSGEGKDLIKLCVQNEELRGKLNFVMYDMKKYFQMVRTWFDEVVALCKNRDLVLSVCSIPGYPAFHACQKFNIPFMILFTMPWTRTREFPHPFMFSKDDNDQQSILHYFTYSLFDRSAWIAIDGIVENGRKNLGLVPTSCSYKCLIEHLTPFIYCFSEALVKKPHDWPPWVHISGFWFLKSTVDYQPAADLKAFLDSGPAPLYIGFGSINGIKDTNLFLQSIFEAIKISKQRAIVSQGWGLSLADMGSLSDSPFEIPKDVFVIGQCPHDWLFQHVSAVCHHGGAGTTSAGLLAGKPTIVISFFGDQFFWGSRVALSGAGKHFRFSNGIVASELGNAFLEAATDVQMRENAQRISEKLKNENGIQNAIDLIDLCVYEFEEKKKSFSEIHHHHHHHHHHQQQQQQPQP